MIDCHLSHVHDMIKGLNFENIKMIDCHLSHVHVLFEYFQKWWMLFLTYAKGRCLYLKILKSKVCSFCHMQKVKD